MTTRAGCLCWDLAQCLEPPCAAPRLLPLVYANSQRHDYGLPDARGSHCWERRAINDEAPVFNRQPITSEPSPVLIKKSRGWRGALSDMAIRQAKPGQKPVKVFDGGGLFLYIMPTGPARSRGGKRIALAISKNCSAMDSTPSSHWPKRAIYETQQRGSEQGS